jgi:hypothetical protein
MKLVERNEYLETLCKDKSVLHLGAAEGIDTREANKEKNNWLHGRLRKVCKKLIGYDLYPQDEPDIIGGDIEETPHYGEYDYINIVVTERAKNIAISIVVIRVK